MTKLLALLPILLLVCVVFVSGCTSSTNLGVSNTNDIVLHPEKYYGQNVTVTAAGMDLNTMVDRDAWLNVVGNYYYISVDDKEGKPAILRVRYDHLYCDTCKLVGTIKTYQACACQSVNRAQDCSEDGLRCSDVACAEASWSKVFNIPLTISVENCEGAPSGRYCYRCEPNSTYNIYYLDVFDVTSLD